MLSLKLGVWWNTRCPRCWLSKWVILYFPLLGCDKKQGPYSLCPGDSQGALPFWFSEPYEIQFSKFIKTEDLLLAWYHESFEDTKITILCMETTLFCNFWALIHVRNESIWLFHAFYLTIASHTNARNWMTEFIQPYQDNYRLAALWARFPNLGTKPRQIPTAIFTSFR